MDKNNFHYKFSAYSITALNKFIETTKLHPKCTNTNWSIFSNSRENPETSAIQSSSTDNIIYISDDEKNITAPEATDLSKDELNYNPTQSFLDQSTTMETTINKSTAEDALQYIKEIVETEGGLLSDEDLVILEKIKPHKLKLFLKNLNETSDINAIYNLGISLCNNNCVVVAKYYCQQILLQKVLQGEQTQIIEQLLLKFTNTFQDVVCIDLLIPIFKENQPPKAIKNLLNTLPSNLKEKVASELIESFEKLQLCHLDTLNTLTTKNMDMKYFRKLMRLMVDSSEEFSNNQTYGKLLICIIRSLDKNVSYFETDCQFIITNHNTLFKKVAEKSLAKFTFELSQMSQSQML